MMEGCGQQLPSCVRQEILDVTKIVFDREARMLEHLKILEQTYAPVMNQKPLNPYICACGKEFDSRGKIGPHSKICSKAKQNKKQYRENQQQDGHEGYPESRTFGPKRKRADRVVSEEVDKIEHNIWESTIKLKEEIRINQQVFQEDDSDQEPHKKVKKNSP